MAQDILNLTVRSPVLTAVRDFFFFSLLSTNWCIAYAFLLVVILLVVVLWVIMIVVFYPFNRHVWVTMCQAVTPSVLWR